MQTSLRDKAIKILGESGYQSARNIFDTYVYDYRKSTYSQFGEDMVLRRLFGDKRAGFYVDIGAYHPTQHSNTYLLYKQGWSGINVDARPGGMKLFNALRKRDINLELAISNRSGTVDYYDWGLNPGNTIAPDQANAMMADFGSPSKVTKIKAVTLHELLDEYVPAGVQIDLLTIDVEGHDLEVLETNNWNKWSPKVLLVEQFADDMEDILSTELHAFMKRQGYALTHALNPTLVYQKRV